MNQKTVINELLDLRDFISKSEDKVFRFAAIEKRISSLSS